MRGAPDYWSAWHDSAWAEYGWGRAALDYAWCVARVLYSDYPPDLVGPSLHFPPDSDCAYYAGVPHAVDSLDDAFRLVDFVGHANQSDRYALSRYYRLGVRLHHCVGQVPFDQRASSSQHAVRAL